MNKQKSVELLQLIATGLTEGALVHRLQGQLIKSLGFTKLGQKYLDHYAEEMAWAEKCYDRILDLGGEVKFEGAKERALCQDPIAYIQHDYEIQKVGVEYLYQHIHEVNGDSTTFDLLKAYLVDEEEDLYWSETALGLIEMIGKQNWLQTQL